MIWTCGSFTFDAQKPTIMGILNMTPDSFSDGGMNASLDEALAHAHDMLAAGASIIDIGGESTRPGAHEVTPDEEWERIKDILEALVREGVCVSVDTRHVTVAEKALAAGASIINDVSGFTDPAMIDAVVGASCGLVVMHMQGTPDTMQDHPAYTDVVNEVRDFLKSQCALLEARGVNHDRICIDPGPGFGKTASQTIELLRNIHELRHLGYPIMAAVSRKSYIAHAYHIDDVSPQARDDASATEALMACELGASVVRAHNVEKTALMLAQLRPYVLLGMGSNVALVAQDGEEDEAKEAQINLAIGQLCQLPDSQIIDIAPFYKSKAAYKESQDDFINTVVLMRTGIPPRELLDRVHGIENMLGRVRTEENGPRTLDIDILDYQMYDFDGGDLILPHPRVTERDFVVKPLMDIVPGHVLADGTPIDCVSEGERLGRAWRR